MPNTTKLVYDSFPYSFTHPEHLGVIAKIMGLNPVDAEQSRVLEIGCASGGNIIPLAIEYPNSEIFGIDISKQDIDIGLESCDELCLDNIFLKNISIEDSDILELGAFDYIICHGVFSWVSDSVRNNILSSIKNLLSPNGLAFISYNTYPGWHQLDALRQMTRYHTKNFDEIDVKVDQTHALLEFLQNGIIQKDSSYFKMLEKEADFIESHPPSYIEQEFLGDNHNSFYFHEFAENAKKYQLTYLSDTSLHSMYLGHFPEQAQETLRSLSKDIIRFEQYIDFITNRRFRQSIVCHENIEDKISRNIDSSRLGDLFVISRLITNNLPDGSVCCLKDGKKVFATDNQIVIAMLQILSETKCKTIAIKELINKTGFLLHNKNNQILEETILGSLLQLFVGDHIILRIKDLDYITKIIDKPAVFKLARYQSSRQDWVTNLRHEKVSIGEFEQKIIPLMDGSTTIDGIIDIITKKFSAKDASEEDLQQLEINQDSVRVELKQIITETLTNLADNALLQKL